MSSTLLTDIVGEHSARYTWTAFCPQFRGGMERRDEGEGVFLSLYSFNVKDDKMERTERRM